MAKKPTKNDKPTPEYDSERETRVLLEDMNKSIKSIAEGHSTLVENQREIKDDLKFVKTAVMEVDSRLKKVEKGQERLEGRLDRVEQKLDTVTTDHEHRLHKLEAVR